ncbi:9101_t:CDS:2, partial [Funneliformis geosporum]
SDLINPSWKKGLPSEIVSEPNKKKASIWSLKMSSWIRATVDISASPTGTYFIFQSGEIPFKWKVEVRQNIVVMSLMKETIDAVNKTAKKIGGALVKGMTGGLVSLDGSEGDAMEGLLGNMEQQTLRMFTSTSNMASETMAEPSVFYSNSTQFPYNLFDFFLRSFTPL